jgi:hypothetical protein
MGLKPVGLKAVQFLSLIFTVLALVPAGAHFFEMPAKLSLARDQYLLVQQLYRGWAYLGAFLLLAIVTNLAQVVLLRRRRIAFHLVAVGFFMTVVALAIFFAWTYPVNLATDNWTAASADWEGLRLRWEYSHAAGAAVLFVALCSLILSVLRIETVPRQIDI